jgi:hypothetical protein
VINPANLNNGVLDNLANANTAFQAGNYANASTYLQAAQQSLSGVTQQLSTDSSNFGGSISAIPQWAVTENDSNLYDASQTISTALTSHGTIQDLAQQILSLANTAASSGLPNNDPQLQAYNTQYQTLLGQLQTAITGASYNGQNLLDGSAILIGSSGTAGQVDIGNVTRTDGTTTPPASLSIDGTNLLQYANGGAGGANDLFNFDLTTTANAQSVVDQINNIVNPAIGQANNTLQNDNGVFGLASNNLDPRASLDNQYRTLVTSATNQITTANLKGSSLISPNTSNATLVVATTGQQLVAHADPNFVANVQNTLASGSALLYSNFAQAIQDLNDASFFATDTASVLGADQQSVTLQTSLVNVAKTNASPADPNNAAFGPFNTTNEAVKQLVAKYLVLSDAQQTSVGGPTDPASVALSLLSGS